MTIAASLQTFIQALKATQTPQAIFIDTLLNGTLTEGDGSVQLTSLYQLV